MAQSSIDRLSPELRAKLQQLLSRPDVTQKQVTEAINQVAGETVVSKSAVNRYAVQMRKWADRNRQAREVVQAWIAEAGPDAQNQLGEALIEKLRQAAFDVMMKLHEIQPDSPEAIDQFTKLISQLSRAVRDLESAHSNNAERRRKIRLEVAEEAARAAGEAGKEAGMSEESVDNIQRHILGIADTP